MVLAMSKRGVMSIPARAPTRVRAQVPEEGVGGGRAGEHDQPGRVLRSRGASVCVCAAVIYAHIRRAATQTWTKSDASHA
jgi:hypothetical protein